MIVFRFDENFWFVSYRWVLEYWNLFVKKKKLKFGIETAKKNTEEKENQKRKKKKKQQKVEEENIDSIALNNEAHDVHMSNSV